MYENFGGNLFWYNYSTSICFDKSCIVWVVGQDEVFYPLVVCYTSNVVQFSFQKCCAKYPQYLYYHAMKRKESYAGNIQIASILVCYSWSVCRWLFWSLDIHYHSFFFELLNGNNKLILNYNLFVWYENRSKEKIMILFCCKYFLGKFSMFNLVDMFLLLANFQTFHICVSHDIHPISRVIKWSKTNGTRPTKTLD